MEKRKLENEEIQPNKKTKLKESNEDKKESLVDEKKIENEKKETKTDKIVKDDSEKNDTIKKVERTKLEKKNIKELKEILKSKNQKVGGKKSELIERILNPEKEEDKKKLGGKRNKIEKIYKKFQDLGVKKPTSNCMLVGIKKGYLNFEGENPLKNVIFTARCGDCSEECNVTIEDVMYQSDYGGDYEDGSEGATFICPHCESNQYVTNMCSGKMSFDSGKFFNHCSICPNNGKCIGDYRNSHCDNCGKHYFSGLSGFPCDCQGGGDEDDFGFF
jgi:hypothetical protein